MLKCESFLSSVFNVCFPPKCDGRIKIKTFSSDIKLLSAGLDSRQFLAYLLFSQ